MNIKQATKTSDPDAGRRLLTSEERDVAKRKVIELDHQGLGVMEIARTTGLSWGTVKKVLTVGITPRKQRQGDTATPRAMSEEQQRFMRVLMRQRNPRGYGREQWTWTRDATADLMEWARERFEASRSESDGEKAIEWVSRLSRRGLDNYLDRWGVQVPKAGIRPLQRADKAAREWWDLHRAEYAGITNIWLNKVVQLDGREWHTLTSPPPNRNLQLLTAETNKGVLHWHLARGVLTPKMKTDFLFNLSEGLTRNRVFIRSSWGDYRDPKVVAFVTANSARITLVPP